MTDRGMRLLGVLVIILAIGLFALSLDRVTDDAMEVEQGLPIYRGAEHPTWPSWEEWREQEIERIKKEESR